MGRIDVVYGMLLGIVSIVFLVLTAGFRVSAGGIDPRVFPRIVVGTLLALSAGLVIRGIAHLRKDSPGPAPLPVSTSSRLALLAGGGAVYALLMGIVGYLVATPPLVALTMVLFGERRVTRIVFVSLLTSVILFFLFRNVFRVPLPRTILW
ncbi:MAG TPA: tripartite tricarboxylate transporter TctB family protein [Magnetospirillaceae bacterium]|nr:tripartite tricarboxylate transporter TctB family protein [Magnetospirillaceae bacterium]